MGERHETWVKLQRQPKAAYADLTFCRPPASTPCEHEATIIMKRPFEHVVEQHGPTVLRVCRALLGRHDADDAWSETFMAALRAYPELPEDTNMQAWLVTIAHRKALDSVRASRRRPRAVADPPDEGVPFDWEPGEDALGQAVRALPPKQRLAVAYHHLAGLPYAEVAAILGGTTDAARRAAHDGIRTLRRTYAPLEGSLS